MDSQLLNQKKDESQEFQVPADSVVPFRSPRVFLRPFEEVPNKSKVNDKHKATKVKEKGKKPWFVMNASDFHMYLELLRWIAEYGGWNMIDSSNFQVWTVLKCLAQI